MTPYCQILFSTHSIKSPGFKHKKFRPKRAYRNLEKFSALHGLVCGKHFYPDSRVQKQNGIMMQLPIMPNSSKIIYNQKTTRRKSPDGNSKRNTNGKNKWNILACLLHCQKSMREKGNVGYLSMALGLKRTWKFPKVGSTFTGTNQKTLQQKFLLRLVWNLRLQSDRTEGMVSAILRTLRSDVWRLVRLRDDRPPSKDLLQPWTSYVSPFGFSRSPPPSSLSRFSIFLAVYTPKISPWCFFSSRSLTPFSLVSFFCRSLPLKPLCCGFPFFVFLLLSPFFFKLSR